MPFSIVSLITSSARSRVAFTARSIKEFRLMKLVPAAIDRATIAFGCPFGYFSVTCELYPSMPIFTFENPLTTRFFAMPSPASIPSISACVGFLRLPCFAGPLWTGSDWICFRISSATTAAPLYTASPMYFPETFSSLFRSARYSSSPCPTVNFAMSAHRPRPLKMDQVRVVFVLDRVQPPDERHFCLKPEQRVLDQVRRRVELALGVVVHVAGDGLLGLPVVCVPGRVLFPVLGPHDERCGHLRPPVVPHVAHELAGLLQI